MAVCGLETLPEDALALLRKRSSSHFMVWENVKYCTSVLMGAGPCDGEAIACLRCTSPLLRPLVFCFSWPKSDLNLSVSLPSWMPWSQGHGEVLLRCLSALDWFARSFKQKTNVSFFQVRQLISLVTSAIVQWFLDRPDCYLGCQQR